jgi:hypothetical protein
MNTFFAPGRRDSLCSDGRVCWQPHTGPRGHGPGHVPVHGPGHGAGHEPPVPSRKGLEKGNSISLPKTKKVYFGAAGMPEFTKDKNEARKPFCIHWREKNENWSYQE